MNDKELRIKSLELAITFTQKFHNQGKMTLDEIKEIANFFVDYTKNNK